MTPRQVEAEGWKFGAREFHSVGYQREIVDLDGETIAWVECYEGDETNARVTRAAPDLLAAAEFALAEALVYCGGEVDDDSPYAELIRRLRAVISKATQG